MQRLLRKITADTLALAVFSLLTGIFGLLFERLVVNLSLVQMAGIRFSYNLLKYLFAEGCAQIADALRARLMGNSKHPFRRALADGLALSGYQIPIYIACSLVVGAKIGQIAMVSSFYIINNLALGWLYGIILNWSEPGFPSDRRKPFEPASHPRAQFLL